MIKYAGLRRMIAKVPGISAKVDEWPSWKYTHSPRTPHTEGRACILLAWIWEFPKMVRSILGSPYFGKLPYKVVCSLLRPRALSLACTLSEDTNTITESTT